MNFVGVTEATLLSTNSLYLSDATKTYEIKYNPEVTGFKYVVSESSIQPLGSPYPIIRRNGNTKYHQFNISGLISCAERDTESTMINEKVYRNELIEFLYSSTPKFFQSYTEGEMIVHLMNISLTPNKQLGRMIYSFSAQVNEIANVADATINRTNRGGQ